METTHLDWKELKPLLDYWRQFHIQCRMFESNCLLLHRPQSSFPGQFSPAITTFNIHQIDSWAVSTSHLFILKMVIQSSWLVVSV